LVEETKRSRNNGSSSSSSSSSSGGGYCGGFDVGESDRNIKETY